MKNPRLAFSAVGGQRRGMLGQRGFSLVELMVALVVGLGVVGALMATLLAGSTSGRHGRALTQMSQDASIALGILREQLSQVGYSHAINVNGAGKFIKAYAGPAAGGAGLAGCDGAFANPTVAAVDLLSCVPVVAGAPSSIAMAYEVDVGNAVMAGGVPTDCLGNGVPPIAVPAPNNSANGLPYTYYVAFNRFYLAQPAGVARKALYCLGNGAPGAQALVENVENMLIQYGVTTNPAAVPVQAGYYAPAAAFNPAAAPLTPAYNGVVSVRLCVLVGSADAVADKDPNTGAWPPYRDCDGTQKANLDGRLYRAFTSTVVLQNKLPM